MKNDSGDLKPNVSALSHAQSSSATLHEEVPYLHQTISRITVEKSPSALSSVPDSAIGTTSMP